MNYLEARLLEFYSVDDLLRLETQIKKDKQDHDKVIEFISYHVVRDYLESQGLVVGKLPNYYTLYIYQKEKSI